MNFPRKLLGEIVDRVTGNSRRPCRGKNAGGAREQFQSLLSLKLLRCTLFPPPADLFVLSGLAPSIPSHVLILDCPQEVQMHTSPSRDRDSVRPVGATNTEFAPGLRGVWSGDWQTPPKYSRFHKHPKVTPLLMQRSSSLVSRQRILKGG